MDIRTITPTELREIEKSGGTIDLIDVRTPAEFAEVHIPFARNFPLDRLDPGAIATGRLAPGSPLYVICRSGGRGKQACEKLLASGMTNVMNVEGGTLAWDKTGLPVVRGKKVMSLERQVRLAAGSLVLLGVALAWCVHPNFIAISAFVGAGLVFAGVTDTCGMGMLLAKMPWNQAAGSCASPTQSTPSSAPSSHTP